MHDFPKRAGAFDDCPLATDGRRIFGMYATPLVTDPKVFVLAGIRARQHVYALDAHTGRLRWDTSLAVTGVEPGYNESAIPLYAGGTVYDGSPLAPVVTALDAGTGRVKWSLRVSGPVKGGFVLRDGVLYFGDLGGKLWAVEATTGRALGSVQTDVTFNVGSPIVLNDSLIDGSAQGPVIAIPLDDIRASRTVAGVTSASRRDVTLVLVVIVLAFLILQVFVRQRRAARYSR
jgi:outer membrane protein assembly factor BamB